MKPPGCFCALLACKAGPNMDTIQMVVSEFNVIQHLPYLQQQSFYGNFSSPASPELRDLS